MIREVIIKVNEKAKKWVMIKLKPLKDSTIGKHSKLAATAFSRYSDGEVEVEELDGKYWFYSGVVEPEWIEKVL